MKRSGTDTFIASVVRKMSSLVAHPWIFRLLMKGNFDVYLCSVTFGQIVPKLNSRPV